MKRRGWMLGTAAIAAGAAGAGISWRQTRLGSEGGTGSELSVDFWALRF